MYYFAYLSIDQLRPEEERGAPAGKTRASIYRFHDHMPIRFDRDLSWIIDWTNETFGKQSGWVDYATVFYWYQDHPAGYKHEPLPAVAQRRRKEVVMRASLQITGTILALVLLAASRSATAIPGTFTFGDDPRCDPHVITLTHELGEAPAFPAEELISALSFGIDLPLTCTTAPPTDPPMPDDFIVTITNLSPFSWIDLFFVADAGIMVGNADGTMKGGDAFKIDTSGINTPLLSESISADLIFAPGEAWMFIVQDWRFVATPDIMGSIGVGAESDDATAASWSSVVAICLDCPVPDITLTQITTGTAGQTVLIPAIPDDGGYGYPFELPPLAVFGGSNPVGPTIATKVVFHDSNSGLIYTENFDSNNPQYITINSGLSQTQYQGVNFMFTTPKGAFYVGRLGSNNSNNVFIARAPYVGGTFTIIEDETTLAAKNGAGTNLFLHACHYNPNSQEQVCFVYSADGIGSWAYIGANTIFSQGYTFTDLAVRGPADLDEMKYRIRYTKDEWVLFGWRDVFGAPQKVYRLSSGASSLVGSAEIGGIDYSFVFRVPGQEGKLFFFGANGFDGIKRADNNDANTLTVVTTDTDVLSSSYAACSTDGMQWMSRWGVGLRGRSTDGGTTWTGLPTLPYGNNYYFAYAGAGASVTSSKWIVAGSIIGFSPDLGQTWMNKEGNSATLIIPPAAALQINDILVVGMPPT